MIPILVLTDNPNYFFQDMRLLKGKVTVIGDENQLRGLNSSIVMVKVYGRNRELSGNFIELKHRVETFCNSRQPRIQKIEL